MHQRSVACVTCFSQFVCLAVVFSRIMVCLPYVCSAIWLTQCGAISPGSITLHLLLRSCSSHHQSCPPRFHRIRTLTETARIVMSRLWLFGSGADWICHRTLLLYSVQFGSSHDLETVVRREFSHLHASLFAVYGFFEKHVSHFWHHVLDISQIKIHIPFCTCSTHYTIVLLFINLSWTGLITLSATLRALTSSLLRKPARELVPDWDGLCNKMERLEEDVLIYLRSPRSARSLRKETFSRSFRRAHLSERSDRGCGSLTCSSRRMVPTSCSNPPDYVLVKTEDFTCLSTASEFSTARLACSGSRCSITWKMEQVCTNARCKL